MKETEGQAERKSKSQVKRELQALRNLGKELTGLSAKQLRMIPMTDALCEAVLSARRFKKEARRRQIQHIGVLLRYEDSNLIQQALDSLKKPQQRDVKAFHQIEQWRNTLLEGNNDLFESLCHRFPQLDRQHLGQLLRNAKKESEQNKPVKSARAIFRYLSSLADKEIE